MKLLSFKLRNFRSIRNATVPLSNLTVLIGPNNEGKSNILHALITALDILALMGRPFTRPAGGIQIPRSLLRQCYEWERDFPVDLQTKEPDGGSTFNLVFELTEEERDSFQREVKSGLVGTLPIEISVDAKFSVSFKVPKQGRGAKAKTQKPDTIARFIGKRLEYDYIPAVRPAEKSQRIVEEMVARELSQLEGDPALQNALQEISRIQQPILDQLSKSIQATLSGFLPEVTGVEIHISEDRRSQALRQSCEIILNDGTPTQLRYKGDGAQSLTALSLMRHTTERAALGRHLLLAIEEPESHLHPNAIHQLKSVLQEISGKRQVVITSHCPLFVDRANIRSNIIVADGKAAPARDVIEIREMLGVRASDNLRHAELVLLMEGEDDRRAIIALLGHHSNLLDTALHQGHLAVDSMAGASNICYKIGLIRDSLCETHCFLDDDDAGRDAFAKAEREGLITMRDVNLAVCAGMQQAELEDMYDAQLYAGMVLNTFRVTLNHPKFSTAKKWSVRMSETFRAQGKPWDDGVQSRLKAAVSQQVVASPSTALNQVKRAAFDYLASALEGRLQNKSTN